jgi:hypothetical protein
MRWRLAVVVLLVAVAPFATQQPGYVVSQYRACGTMLATASDLGLQPVWAQLFTLSHVLGWDVPAPAQSALRGLAAVATLVVVWLASRRFSPGWSAWLLYAWAACYLMLFNPRTENNTYSILAPALGVVCAHTWLVRQRRWATVACVAMTVGIVGSYEIGKAFTGGAYTTWPAPLMAIGFSILLGWLTLADPAVTGLARRDPADDRQPVTSRGETTPLRGVRRPRLPEGLAPAAADHPPGRWRG